MIYLACTVYAGGKDKGEKMKRFIALMTLLATVILSMTSCARLSAAKDLQDAYPTDGQDYSTESTMDFGIDDENILKLYPALSGKVKVSARMCGGNMKSRTDMPSNAGEIESEQTLVDNTLYIKQKMTYAGVEVASQRLRVELTAEQRAEILADDNTTTGFGIGDFGSVKKEKTEGGVTYILGNFKDGSESGLEELVCSLLGSSEAEVKTVKLNLTVTIVDGFVSTEKVECEFLVRDGSYEFTLPMTMENSYKLETKEITVPINESTYKLVPYDMIFGE